MAIHGCVRSRETSLLLRVRVATGCQRERERVQRTSNRGNVLPFCCIAQFILSNPIGIGKNEKGGKYTLRDGRDREKKEEREKKASYTRALFNLDARKHWINDLRERKTPFTEPFRLHGGDGVSRRILGYGKIHGIPREGERNKRERNAAPGTRDARKRVFNVFSSGAEPLGAHLDGIKSGHPFENRPCS